MDKAKELDKYIRAKHTQEECIGFIDGFEVAEQRIKELEEELTSMRARILIYTLKSHK